MFERRDHCLRMPCILVKNSWSQERRSVNDYSKQIGEHLYSTHQGRLGRLDLDRRRVGLIESFKGMRATGHSPRVRDAVRVVRGKRAWRA